MTGLTARHGFGTAVRSAVAVGVALCGHVGFALIGTATTAWAAAAQVSSIPDDTVAASQTRLCVEADRFLRDAMGMQTLIEPDTIDDWRTQAMVPGCRVTAAGGSPRAPVFIAREFFDVLGDSGWERTPDPRDAPNEASIRFRRGGADCLFTFYDRSVALGTDAEFAVSDAVDLERGESLYYFLVMCTPAAPAAPRGG